MVADLESELDAAMPMHPPESIHSAMRYAVLPAPARRGATKRAPPMLCVAASELLAAAAMEMLHAASLVRDDLPCFDAAPAPQPRQPRPWRRSLGPGGTTPAMTELNSRGHHRPPP